MCDAFRVRSVNVHLERLVQVQYIPRRSMLVRNTTISLHDTTHVCVYTYIVPSTSYEVHIIGTEITCTKVDYKIRVPRTPYSHEVYIHRGNLNHGTFFGGNLNAGTFLPNGNSMF